MCRPVRGSRAKACPGGHIGPPLRNDWMRSEPTENWGEGGPCQRGGTKPAPYRRNASGAQHRADVGIGPYGTKRKPAATAGAAL